MPTSLLPSNSTSYELAVEGALDYGNKFYDALNASKHIKLQRPLPEGFGSFVVSQEGLSSISQFFTTHEEVLDNGLPWIDLRETPAGVTTALSWIGYTSPSLEDQNIGRRKWNRYQINLGQLPPENEVETLIDAEYLADLSDGARDVPFRGFHGYDVRAIRTGRGKTGRNRIANSSGVRVQGGSTKWSHGEAFSVSSVATVAEKTFLGVDYIQGQKLKWENIPWAAPGITWNGIQNVALFKSWRVLQANTYIAFFDSADELIGLSRVGNWKSSGIPAGDDAVLTFTTRTNFGDGAGKIAASCAMMFSANNTDETKPGKKWLEPNDISLPDGISILDASIGKTAIAINFKETVRVRTDFTLTI